MNKQLSHTFKQSIMTTETKVYLTKAYTFLNELYTKCSDKREMYEAWEKLMVYMNIDDGVEARNLLVQWKQAGNYNF